MENQNYIVFESYLSNELSKDEVATFESRLKTERDFNQAFQTYKEASSFLENKFENEDASAEFQSNLENISGEFFIKEEGFFLKEEEAPKKVIQFKPWQYAMAASVALLVGIFMFNNSSNPSFDEYNDYKNISLTVRGVNDDLLQTAETAFNDKEFAKAEEALGHLLNEDGSNKEWQLYRGISLMELNLFDEADSLFGKLSTGASAFKNRATWFLALSKLKQENNDACLEILKTIPEDADDYKQAQKLIKKLD